MEKIVKAHTSGQRNYAFELHKILTLEFIHRKLIELGLAYAALRALDLDSHDIHRWIR